MTLCEINSVEDEENAEVGESILEAFRSAPEQCQLIVKSEMLGESIEGIIMSHSLLLYAAYILIYMRCVWSRAPDCIRYRHRATGDVTNSDDSESPSSLYLHIIITFRLYY